MSGPDSLDPGEPDQDDLIIGDGADEPAGELEPFSQAYSAPESEQLPYVTPADPHLYDYDGYTEADDGSGGGGVFDDAGPPPRWPWVVGVSAIIAAIALVVSVSLLVNGADTATDDMVTAVPTTSLPPVHDEFPKTTPPPPPPPPPAPTSEEPPPPPPPPPPSEEPPPETTAPPETTSTTPAGPRQVTYAVTGTKAPGDIISVTYIDASGHRRTQRNVYIPWSITVTPISTSEVGSVEASSLFRVSRLNCSITANDGTVLSSSSNNAPQTSC